MQDRILEIVVYLMNQLSEEQGSLNSIDDMSDDLRSMGFTDKEISSAYSWLLNHFEDYPESFEFRDKNNNRKSFRVLSDIERKIISAEGYGYLLQLRQLGLLTTEQFEMILDRCALFTTDPVSSDEVKLFASATMFDTASTDLSSPVWIDDPENEAVN